jgi:hypothetical protein
MEDFVKDNFLNKVAEECINRFEKININFPTKKLQIASLLQYVGMVKYSNDETEEKTFLGIDTTLNHKFQNFTNETNEKEKNNDLKFFYFPNNEVKKLGETIFDILEKDKNNKEVDKKISLVKEVLKESLDKCFPIEINDKKIKKADDFIEFISKVENVLGDYNFENKLERKSTPNKYNIDIVKLNGKEYYNAKIYNNNHEVKISANSLPEFRDKIVEKVSENLENKKGYFKGEELEIYDIKKLEIEKLKENIDNIKIETSKNIDLNITNFPDRYSNYSLKIEDKKSILKNEDFDFSRKMAYIITNDDYFELTEKQLINSFNKADKINYIKEETKEYIKLMDKIVEEQPLKDIEESVYFKTLDYLCFTQDDLSFSNISTKTKNIYNRYFNDRIDCIKDKETFIKNNASDFGLSLKNGKLEEISTEDKTEYNQTLTEIIEIYKEKSLNNLLEKMEEFRKNEKSSCINYGNFGDWRVSQEMKEEHTIRESMSSLNENYDNNKSEFFNLQKIVLKNITAIELSEDKMNLSEEQLDNLKNVPYDIAKKLSDRVNNHFNSLSDNLCGEISQGTLKVITESFKRNKYAELCDDMRIELPNEKVKSNELEETNIKINKEIER